MCISLISSGNHKTVGSTEKVQGRGKKRLAKPPSSVTNVSFAAPSVDSFAIYRVFNSNLVFFFVLFMQFILF